jgi:hypothetical protein
VPAVGKTLGETEAEDVTNRARWKDCIVRHNLLRACYAKVDEYLKATLPPSKP